MLGWTLFTPVGASHLRSSRMAPCVSAPVAVTRRIRVNSSSHCWTAARLGEVFSLQWKDVNRDRRELLIRAVKSKTRTGRTVPISGRLLATLEMRKLDPAGEPLRSDAYVFGDAIGRRVKSGRTAWENACEKRASVGCSYATCVTKQGPDSRRRAFQSRW